MKQYQIKGTYLCSGNTFYAYEIRPGKMYLIFRTEDINDAHSYRKYLQEQAINYQVEEVE